MHEKNLPKTQAVYRDYLMIRHPLLQLGMDPWHLDKYLAKLIRQTFFEKTVKLTPEELAQRNPDDRKLTRLEWAAELDICDFTAEHFLQWVRALRLEYSNLQIGDVEFRKKWLEAAVWLQDRAGERLMLCSESFFEAFAEFLSKTVDSVCASRFRVFTSEEESFHNVGMKYWRKGYKYTPEDYMARRSLQALDWNEHHGNPGKTNRFRDILLQRFRAIMESRLAT